MRLYLGILRYGWLVAGSLFVACDDDTTSPGRRLTDTYVLQYVNADPLPFAIDVEEYIRPQALLAEELDFRSSGEVVRARTMWHSRERGDTTETVVMQHEYQVQGSDIEIGSFVECPPNAATADCLPNDRGMLTADGLELQAFSLPFVSFAEPPMLTYERR